MLLMIDNYDSFTYNLVQYFGELGQDVRVHRNDQISLEEIDALRPDHICISPGPCSPAEAGISIDVIKRYAGKVPLLGVCSRLSAQRFPTAWQSPRRQPMVRLWGYAIKRCQFMAFSFIQSQF
jgi:anthranilate synthase/aminodeoxychorismate synthase-like glutamine amidotransferase